jgi:broad specificity phosphatase PhoE
MFVLRGQELSYYTVDSKSKQRYGALKGSMNVRGAAVERVDNLSFTLTLSADGNAAASTTRVLGAPDVQALFDWMTAIAIAAEAYAVPPPDGAGLALVDHSRTTHIILVRHGHYATSQTPAEDLHGPLTDLGIRQARATGRFVHDYLSARLVLKRFPRGFPIVHSGVRRSVETARHMAEAFATPGAVELRENKLFREAWPGNPLPNANRKLLAREKLDNMVSDCARLKVVYRTQFRHLVPADLREQEQPLSEQDVAQFMSTIGARGSTQSRVHDRYRVVVCHANIIRWFVCKALGVDPDGSWGRMRHNHAGVTILEVDSVGNVQLATVNGTGHLATDLLSEA